MKQQLIIFISVLTLGNSAFGETPVKQVNNVEFKSPGVLLSGTAELPTRPEGKPLILKSVEDAKKYFDGRSLLSISKAVNFQKQEVLVFFWRGSVSDKIIMRPVVDDSEKIEFVFSPGDYLDLGPQKSVFVVNSDLDWSFEKKHPLIDIFLSDRGRDGQ